MARYRRKRRKSAVRPGSRSAHRPHSTDIVRGTRSRRSKKGFGAFLRRNYKIVAAAGLVLVVGIIALFLFVIGKDTVPAAEVADAADISDANVSADQQTPPDVSADIGDYVESSEYDIEDLDEGVLEGLTGSDDSLFTDTDEDLADALFAEEGIRIGVTIGKLASDNDEMQLSKLEASSSIAKTGKVVYDVYFYDAHGDYNQQLQDVRSMIKNEVDVIIVGATDEKSFNMVVGMATAEGIPVVAYDAPGSSAGYAVNVVADQLSWGKTYGDFMAANLTEGGVLNVLGSDESEIDAQREQGITDALAANENIEIDETVYAKWDEDKAKAAMTAYLEKSDVPSGIITEEGMAQAILQACVDVEELPTVMCGDATAGFIRMWYALTHEGIDITPPPEDGEEEDPEAPRIMLKAEKGELIVCAQPAPVSIGAVAFDIAVKLAEGRQLKALGSTFVYVTETVLTEDDLVETYVIVKDQPDDYVVRDTASEQTIESLFKPAAPTE